MNQQTPLHLVGNSELDGAVDSWLVPGNLPPDVSIFPRRFPGERHWKFNAEQLQLFPMPAQVLSDTVKDYEGYPVLGYSHMDGMLQQQSIIPDTWRPYKIYFPLDRFWRIGAPTSFIYMTQYQNGDWKKSEVRLDERPAKGLSRLIMMR